MIKKKFIKFHPIQISDAIPAPTQNCTELHHVPACTAGSHECFQFRVELYMWDVGKVLQNMTGRFRGEGELAGSITLLNGIVVIFKEMPMLTPRSFQLGDSSVIVICV